MNPAVANFFGGAIAFGFWIICLFFLKFWRRTRDPLFGGFALAFFTLGIGRILEAVLRNAHASTPGVYLIRLLAFSIIILVIVQKNLAARKR